MASLVNDTSDQDMDGTNGTSVVTPGFANTAGNLLVAVFRCGDAGANGTISDTAGNTYTPVGSVGSPPGFQVWMVANCLAAVSNVVTVTYSSRSFTAVTVMQFDGVPTTVTINEFASTAVSSGASVSCVPDSGLNSQIVVA